MMMMTIKMLHATVTVVMLLIISAVEDRVCDFEQVEAASIQEKSRTSAWNGDWEGIFKGPVLVRNAISLFNTIKVSELPVAKEAFVATLGISICQSHWTSMDRREVELHLVQR